MKVQEKVKVKIKEKSWLAKLAARNLRTANVAMVLGSTVHLHGVGKKDFLSNERWLRHELKHVEQVQRLGLLRFLWSYAWESIRVGYHKNKFEAEARAAEDDDMIAANYRVVGDDLA